VKSVVVYESRYGNTARVAHAISTRLSATGTVQLIEANDPGAFDQQDVDLLIVGGPTEGHGMSRTMRERLAQVPASALTGVVAAAFDTRLDWPAFLAGSAAQRIADALSKKGATLVATPESFLGTGTKEFRLHDGELERAGDWAATIAAKVGTAVPTAP